MGDNYANTLAKCWPNVGPTPSQHKTPEVFVFTEYQFILPKY